ncbi:MAG: hypothetical protein NTZ48_07135, partial [Candidatus Omnitrophica bacterium]|nr:hypothetical protein [Candidatus Omnitrophota bacterium]
MKGEVKYSSDVLQGSFAAIQKSYPRVIFLYDLYRSRLKDEAYFNGLLANVSTALEEAGKDPSFITALIAVLEKAERLASEKIGREYRFARILFDGGPHDYKATVRTVDDWDSEFRRLFNVDDSQFGYTPCVIVFFLDNLLQGLKNGQIREEDYLLYV